jgi:spore coat protein U-like protein
MKTMIKALATAGVLAFAGGAQAATATGTFTVTATVLKSCTVGATNIAFGNYTPGGGNLTGNSTVSVKCTKTTPYSVDLNAGTTAGGAYAQRLMTDGVNTLQYNLYMTAGFAQVFGDGSGTTGHVAGAVGLGLGAAAQTYTAFGQLPDNATNQNATPGATAYSDTIMVTVTY